MSWLHRQDPSTGCHAGALAAFAVQARSGSLPWWLALSSVQWFCSPAIVNWPRDGVPAMGALIAGGQRIRIGALSSNRQIPDARRSPGSVRPRRAPIPSHGRARLSRRCAGKPDHYTPESHRLGALVRRPGPLSRQLGATGTMRIAACRHPAGDHGIMGLSRLPACKMVASRPETSCGV